MLLCCPSNFSDIFNFQLTSLDILRILPCINGCNVRRHFKINMQSRMWLTCLLVAAFLPFGFAAAGPPPPEPRVGNCHFPFSDSPQEACPGVSFANDGRSHKFSCPADMMIDPKQIWSQYRTRGGIERRVLDEFEKHKDLDRLALWFVCQGFQGGYGFERAYSSVNRTVDFYIHATLSNKNGIFDEYYVNKYTLFDAKALYIEIRLTEEFSIRKIDVGFPNQFQE